MAVKDDLKPRTKKIVKKLKDYYGEVKCYLTHKNAFEFAKGLAERSNAAIKLLHVH